MTEKAQTIAEGAEAKEERGAGMAAFVLNVRHVHSSLLLLLQSSELSASPL